MSVEELPEPLAEAIEEPEQIVESLLMNSGIAGIGGAIGMRIVASYIAADVCGASEVAISSCTTLVYSTANPLIKGAALFGGTAIILGILASEYNEGKL